MDNIITKEEGGTKSLGAGVKFSKLYSLASRSDMCLMYTGWLCSALSGFGMPSWVFLIGEILDTFNQVNNSPDEILKTIKMISAVQCGLGVFIWITNYIYYSCLLSFSERVVFKTRVTYLKSILKQDSAWFDLTNPQELNSRIGKECQAMAKALGEKMGTIIMAFAMTISGMAFAFSRGWSFSLIVMGSFPGIAITTNLITKIMQGGF